MSKRIKFKLTMNGHAVRTIEDLQKYFSINEILDYFYQEDKLLLLWLDLGGYTKEYEQVSAIKSTDPKQIIMELIKIFSVDLYEDDVDFVLLTKGYKYKDKIKQSNCSKLDRTTNYLQGYENLKSALLTYDDIEKCRYTISELVKKYLWILEFTISDIFRTILDCEAKCALISILSESKTLGLLQNSIKENEWKISRLIDELEDEDDIFFEKHGYEIVSTNGTKTEKLIGTIILVLSSDCSYYSESDINALESYHFGDYSIYVDAKIISGEYKYVILNKAKVNS